MGEKVFFGKGIRQIKMEDPELYDSIENLDKNIWNANVLDYRTQKLIAIAISATNHESSSFSFKTMLNIFFSTLKISYLE